MRRLEHFYRTWISPRGDEEEPCGEVYIRTPDGKTEITAKLRTERDARKMKEVFGILFPSLDLAAVLEESETLGRTE